MPAECFGGDAGGSLVAVDSARHDAAGIPELRAVPGILRRNCDQHSGRSSEEADRSWNYQDPTDGRKLTYVLTRKGIDLAPVLTEMVLWAARHEETENQALVRLMQKDKEQFLASVRQRWAAQRTRATPS